jgi:hypothetical protein
MTNELKDRIKNFIVSWDNTIDDETMGLAEKLLKNEQDYPLYRKNEE